MLFKSYTLAVFKWHSLLAVDCTEMMVEDPERGAFGKWEWLRSKYYQTFPKMCVFTFITRTRRHLFIVIKIKCLWILSASFSFFFFFSFSVLTSCGCQWHHSQSLLEAVCQVFGWLDQAGEKRQVSLMLARKLLLFLLSALAASRSHFPIKWFWDPWCAEQSGGKERGHTFLTPVTGGLHITVENPIAK